jgi:hypothetical protein
MKQKVKESAKQKAKQKVKESVNQLVMETAIEAQWDSLNQEFQKLQSWSEKHSHSQSLTMNQSHFHQKHSLK